MPLPSFAPPRSANPREIPVNWTSFRGGWNSFAREVELKKDELAEAKNLILIGTGIPTKRWGSQDYFLGGATGYGRGLYVAKSNTGTEEILALTDWGYLTKKQGASYAMIEGASFASGYNAEMTQLNNNIYIMNGQREMTKYDFSVLQSFVTIASPNGLSATNFSGATGARTQSWRITAVSQTGETIGSTPISLTSLPQDLSTTLVKLQWTPVSAASGVLQGYNIYRGLSGDERFLGATDPDVTTFDDIGDDTSLIRTLPTFDTTGGPVAKYIVRFQDRLVLAGFPNDPTKIMISGRVPNHERFDWAGGGGFVLIDPDSGEDITGIGVLRDSIIVFKENSTWEVKLQLTQIGDYVVLEPVYRLLTAAKGCVSHKSIVAIDNDLGFVGRPGMFFLGQEARYDTTLRVNEMSARIRPFFESLSEADITNCSSSYVRNRWIVNFPSSKRMVVYDRERLALMGPWSTPFGISNAVRYVDSNNIEMLLAIDYDDPYVTDFRPSYPDDKGAAIRTQLKSRKEDYGDWSLFKTLRDVYFQFRNLTGEVHVRVYGETAYEGTEVLKEFDINGNSSRSGWGIDQWGKQEWGLSSVNAKASSDEFIKKALINQTIRTYQVEIETDNRDSNYELLGVKSKAIAQGVGTEPADDWNVI